MFQRSFLSLLIVVSLFLGCQTSPPPISSESGSLYSESHLDYKTWNRDSSCCALNSKKVAIVSGSQNASNIGLKILKDGGNIIDAAIAVSFAVNVERPQHTGIGGGGFATLHLVGKKGGDFFVDFRERAPKKASRDMFLDKEGKPVKDLSLNGGLAVATPGFVAGMYELHRKWGKLPWAKVVQPAADLARKGFSIYPSLAKRLVSRKEVLSKDEYLKSIFFPSDQPTESLEQKDLANTLELIAKEKEKVFYRGALAKKIVESVKKAGGILELEDLKNYKVIYRKPVVSQFTGFTLVSAPPPSAGGVMLTQMLKALEAYDLKAIKEKPAEYIHLLSEVMKRPYADRSQFLGDPDFFKVDYQKLLSKGYIEGIQSNINLKENTPSDQIKPGHLDEPKKHGTTHLSLMDSEGNAVAITISLNGSFGASLGVPGTGILLNNTMDDFSIKPGEKNVYGLTGGEGNSIAPLKTPVSSMTPTILLNSKSKKPFLVLGGAGGSRIITGVFEVILNEQFVYPGDLKKSMFAPRVHHQWTPDELELEKGFEESVRNRLTNERKHKLVDAPYPVQIQSVYRDLEKDEFTAVFDPRDHGGVAGN